VGLERAFSRHCDDRDFLAARPLLQSRSAAFEQAGRLRTLKTLMADHEGTSGAVCRLGADGLESVNGYIARPAKGLFQVRRGRGCVGFGQPTVFSRQRHHRKLQSIAFRKETEVLSGGWGLAFVTPGLAGRRVLRGSQRVKMPAPQEIWGYGFFIASKDRGSACVRKG